ALGDNPAADAALRRELGAVLGGRAPQFDDLPRLRYTAAVIAESLRLYPPAWVMTREVVEPHHAGGTALPAGAIVVMSQLLLHRDPRFFADPLAFRPERWHVPDAGRPRLAYFPFGA